LIEIPQLFTVATDHLDLEYGLGVMDNNILLDREVTAVIVDVGPVAEKQHSACLLRKEVVPPDSGIGLVAYLDIVCHGLTLLVVQDIDCVGL